VETVRGEEVIESVEVVRRSAEETAGLEWAKLGARPCLTAIRRAI
jgi:hypothetical protein